MTSANAYPLLPYRSVIRVISSRIFGALKDFPVLDLQAFAKLADLRTPCCPRNPTSAIVNGSPSVTVIGDGEPFFIFGELHRSVGRPAHSSSLCSASTSLIRSTSLFSSSRFRTPASDSNDGNLSCVSKPYQGIHSRVAITLNISFFVDGPHPFEISPS